MLSFLTDLLNKFGDFLLKVLPTSPFRPYINYFSDLPYLGILNWFIPVKDIITVCEVWLGAIALFYVYSIIMRWVKMIGD